LRINILFCIVVSFTLFSSGCIQSNNNIELFGTEYKNPPDAPDFTLLNQDGESVTLSDYDGKIVVVAFIYTPALMYVSQFQLILLGFMKI